MQILIFLGGFLFGVLCVSVPFFIVNKNKESIVKSQIDAYKNMQEQVKLYFENTEKLKILKNAQNRILNLKMIILLNLI